ncbi:MAG: nuclear transport factor 2 family protein [Candidatus Wenzhouxiangella sp. M2_3B_020]
MIKVLTAAFLAAALAVPADAADAERALRDLLVEFLDGASTNDAAMHDRFWAEDLVYTSSSGERFGKSTIMQGLTDATAADAERPTYSGEDIAVRAFGDIGVVTFRLVADLPDGSTHEYFNTGVFRRIDGAWKAFAWQATKIPETDR